MKNKLTLTGLTLAMAVFPAVSLAANKPVASTDDSAIGLLRSFRVETARAEHDATDLQTVARNLRLEWTADAASLENLKADVNAMGKMLARLEEIRDSALPEEQKTIDEAKTLLKQIAGDTEATIRFMNENRSELWLPEYRQRVQNLVNETGRLSKRVTDCVQLDEVRAKEKRLQTEFGSESGS